MVHEYWVGHLALSSTLYLQSGTKGVEVGVGSDRYFKEGNWYYGDDISFIRAVADQVEPTFLHGYL